MVTLARQPTGHLHVLQKISPPSLGDALGALNLQRADGESLGPRATTGMVVGSSLPNPHTPARGNQGFRVP